MAPATSYLLKEAVIPADALALEQTVDEITPEQIRSMPCKHLKILDQLWRQASADRFEFGMSVANLGKFSSESRLHQVPRSCGVEAKRNLVQI